MSAQETLDQKAAYHMPDWLVKQWQDEQCEACRNGDRSRCSATKHNAVGVRIEPDGTAHYYCFLGCMMLDLMENCDPSSLKDLIESQFNSKGHYEKLANP